MQWAEGSIRLKCSRPNVRYRFGPLIGVSALSDGYGARAMMYRKTALKRTVPSTFTYGRRAASWARVTASSLVRSAANLAETRGVQAPHRRCEVRIPPFRIPISNVERTYQTRLLCEALQTAPVRKSGGLR